MPRKLYLVFIALMLTISARSQTTFFSYRTNWKYLDDGSDPGQGWKMPAFDDGAWKTGLATLGYGNPVVTCIKPGPACGTNNCTPEPSYCGKFITYYFRKKITISNPQDYSSFSLNMIRDDGAVIYVNGMEVWRTNMPAGAILPTTLAASAAAETIIYSTTIASSFFNDGENTIAVEVHQNATNSTDLLFNLELIANDRKLSRGPYLQMANENAVSIRWRTNDPADSRVEVGTSPGVFASVFTNSVATTEHEIRVTGLTANTRYYYRIGSTTEIFKEDTDMYFITAPTQTTNRKIGIAVFGDCGRDDNGFRSGSLAAYKNYTGDNPADIMLLLGDNAYNNGTDHEYTINFFNPLSQSLLKNHVLFPSPGNHDYGAFLRTERNGPYYNNFTMPTDGECGGLPSGSEAYYSFNWGDIHFISLDSYGHEAGNQRMYDTLSPQVVWLKEDLRANSRKWVIAFWHHPPYTMGSHNSDSETELVNIRQNFIRILERSGVDLVLSGHSHNYERSKLIRGHYGTEATYHEPTHSVNSSSGKYDHTANSCPYKTSSLVGDHGIVYVVSGSSGADGGVQSGYPHNAMPYSVDDGGMLYLEVDGNRLDARFLRRDNTIADQFTIVQDVDAERVVTTTVGQAVTLEAPWPGTYSWSGGQTTRSVTFTPSTPGQQVYTVKDGESETCLAQEITVNVATALPVVLIDFTLQRRAAAIALKWTTGNEMNNNHFIVERSTNSRDFRKIATIPGQSSGSKNEYSFLDENTPVGVLYYRLTQIDHDGKATRLGTKSISYRSTQGLQLDVENPSSASLAIPVRINHSDAGPVHLSLKAVNGKLISRRRISIDNAEIAQTLVVPSTGTYIVSATDGSGKKVSQKVVVHY